MKTTPMMKTKMIFLMRMKKFQKVFLFFSFNVSDMLQVGEIALIKADNPVH